MNEVTIEVVTKDSTAAGVASVKENVAGIGTEVTAAGASVDEMGNKFTQQGSKVETINTQVGGLAPKLSSTGSTLGTATSVALGNAMSFGMQKVGQAVSTGFADAMDFQESEQKLKAMFGNNQAEAQVAGDAAGKLFAEGYSGGMDAIGSAVRLVITSSAEMANATTEDVQTITGQFLSLAKVMNVDVSESIKTVATLVKTGMVPDMQAGLDLVATAYEKLGPAADSVLPALQANAEQFQRLGIQGPEALGLIVQGMDAGGKSASAVTDAFKLFTNTVLSGSKTSEQGLVALGLATEVLGTKSTKAAAQSHATFTVQGSDVATAEAQITALGLTIDSQSTKAAKAGGTTSESFKVSGAAVDQLKSKLESSGVSMSTFTQTIASGSASASSALKVVGINADDIRGKLAAGGPAANEAFTTIITRLQDMKDPLQQNTVGTEIFGKSWKTVSESLLSLNPSTAVSGLGQVDGAAKNLNATVEDTTKHKIDAWKQSFQEWTASMVNLPGVLGSGGAAMAAFGASGLGALSSIAQLSQVISFKGIIAGIKEFRDSAIADFVATSASAVANAAVVTAAWMVANAAMLLAGGLIIVAIVAIIAIVVLLIQHWGWVKDAAGACWDFIKSAVGLAVEFVMNTPFALLIRGIIWVVQNWQMLADGIGAVMSWIIGVVGAAIGWLTDRWNQFMGFFGGIASTIARFGSDMWDGIVNGARGAVNLVVDGINLIIEAINALISAYDSIPMVPQVGMIPHVGHMASGGLASGMTIVGEHGPELVNLPGGSQVIPAGTTRAMLNQGGGVTAVTLTIDSSGSPMDDLIAQLLRKYVRVNGAGSVQRALGS